MREPHHAPPVISPSLGWQGIGRYESTLALRIPLILFSRSVTIRRLLLSFGRHDGFGTLEADLNSGTFLDSAVPRMTAFRTVFVLCLLLVASRAQAQETRTPEPESTTPSAPEIEQAPDAVAEVTEASDVAQDERRMLGRLVLNLVVDETQTRIGRDFYDLFFSIWEFPPGGEQHQTITVQELPVPGVGTRVAVLVDGETAFETQIQPRYDVIEMAAQQAAGFTYRFIQQRSNSQTLYP